MSEGDEVKVEGQIKVTEVKVNSECEAPRKVMVTEVKVKVNEGRTTVGNKSQHVQARRDVRVQVAAGSVRQSWSEQVVEFCLTVALAMRHHIIGPKGTTITRIEAQCRGVRVSVPPPKDLKDVRVRGPAGQVAAAVSCLEAVLQREQHVVASVRVEPHQRHHPHHAARTLSSRAGEGPAAARPPRTQHVRARPAGQRGTGRDLHQRHPAPGGQGQGQGTTPSSL